jgi:hypothetical protein
MNAGAIVVENANFSTWEDCIADAKCLPLRSKSILSTPLLFPMLQLSHPAFPNSDQIVNLSNEANFAYIFVLKNLLHAIKMRTNYISEDRSPRP